MRNFRFLALCAIAFLVFLPVLGSAQASSAKNFFFNSGSALTAAGATTPVNVSDGTPPSYVTIEIWVTGSPTTCSFELEGTALNLAEQPKAADYRSLSGPQDCSINSPLYKNGTVMFHVTDRPVNTVRGNLTALSGGAAPTVKIRYVGVVR